ncbi:MAG: InlB B-repeat-containing protein [Wujia sp.]
MVKQRLLTGIMAATLAISGICPVSYAAEPAGEESTIQEAEEVTAIDSGEIPVWDSSDRLTWKLYSDGNLVISGDDGAKIKEFTFGFSSGMGDKVKKITSDTLMYYSYDNIKFLGMMNLEEINLPFLTNENYKGIAEPLFYYDSNKLRKINLPKLMVRTHQKAPEGKPELEINDFKLFGESADLEYICFSNAASDMYSREYLDKMLDTGYGWYNADGNTLTTGIYTTDGGSEYEIYYSGTYPITKKKIEYTAIRYQIKYSYKEDGAYYYADGKVVSFDPEKASSYTGGVRVEAEGGSNIGQGYTYTIGTDMTIEPQEFEGYTLISSENNVIKPEDYGYRKVTFEYISNDVLKMVEGTTTEEPTTEEPTTEEPTTEEPTTEEPTTEQPVIDEPVVTPSYKLSYNANGGTVSKTSKTLKVAAKYGTLPSTKRTGYTFLGWYTAKSGGTKVSASTKMAGKNTTIYAHWKKITVKQEQIKSAERAKNKLSVTVRYTRDYSADGYRIQYSTSPTFGKSVTKYVKGNSTTSYKITNLNKSKTYYVRVAAYKYDSAGKKVYGKNSSRKTIK